LKSTEADYSICPNCGRLNAKETNICVSCGINTVDYNLVKEKFDKVKDDDIKAFVDQQTKVNAKQLHDKIAVSDYLLRKRIKFLIFGFVLSLILFAGLSIIISHQLRLRNERALANYQLANQCLHEMDYACALDYVTLAQKGGLSSDLVNPVLSSIFEYYSNYNFAKGRYMEAIIFAEDCLDVDSENNICLTIFCEANMEFIEEKIHAKQWSYAIDDLKIIHGNCPDIDTIENHIHEAYKNWYQYELSKARMLRAYFVRRQWESWRKDK
jgi:tetratricopeptide (TPR) repeat protein